MSFLLAHTTAPTTSCQSAKKNDDNPSSIRCTWLHPPHNMCKPNSSQKHAGADNFFDGARRFQSPTSGLFPPPHLSHLHSVTFRRLHST